MTKRVSSALLMAAALALTPISQGKTHPHAFIDITVEAQFDEAGQLTALEQTWLFDVAYTAFALFDLRGKTAEEQQATLDAIVGQNLTELAAFDYFTEIRQGDDIIATGTAIKQGTALVNQRIEMRFTLPVTDATNPGTPVTYEVFDPTYYIEMRHQLGAKAIQVSHPGEACDYQLIEPTPTTEQIFFAASIPPQVTAPEGLGRLFTETVTITCGEG
ncbi:MAG: DUF1007 family protein [Pseudomonadota bacterium]